MAPESNASATAAAQLLQLLAASNHKALHQPLSAPQLVLRWKLPGRCREAPSLAVDPYLDAAGTQHRGPGMTLGQDDKLPDAKLSEMGEE